MTKEDRKRFQEAMKTIRGICYRESNCSECPLWEQCSYTADKDSHITPAKWKIHIDENFPLEYVIHNGEVSIVDCDKELESVVIPSEIRGYPVTTIGSCAFQSCTRLTSVILPNSVTRIDTSAFYGCVKLVETFIPDSVTSIGDLAFMACHELKSLTIPKSVEHIGRRALGYCNTFYKIEDFVLCGEKDSAVERFSITNEIMFEFI
jgi:hypothetical protein